MILKPEFAHMVNSMGLEDGELALAEIVWQKAERAMQGKPVQEAKVLKKQDFVANAKLEPNALTQAELQTLTDGIAFVLHGYERQLKEMKLLIEKLWNKSNPDDPESKISFDTMNTIRNMQRKVKKDHAKLARIQHKLKKQMGR